MVGDVKLCQILIDGLLVVRVQTERFHDSLRADAQGVEVVASLEDHHEFGAQFPEGLGHVGVPEGRHPYLTQRISEGGVEPGRDQHEVGLELADDGKEDLLAHVDVVVVAHQRLRGFLHVEWELYVVTSTLAFSDLVVLARWAWVECTVVESVYADVEH